MEETVNTMTEELWDTVSTMVLLTARANSICIMLNKIRYDLLLVEKEFYSFLKISHTYILRKYELKKNYSFSTSLNIC